MSDNTFESRIPSKREKKKSEAFVTGYTRAENDFMLSKNPKHINPFEEGTDEHRGYEEGAYDFTQK